MKTVFARVMAAVAVMLGVAATTARADIVLDDFSIPSPATTYAIGPDANPSVITTDLGGGVTRTITLSVTSAVITNALTGQVGDGLFFAAFNPLSSGSVSLQYSYASSLDFIPNVPLGGELGALQFLAFGDNGTSGGNVPIEIVIGTTTGDLTYTGGLPLASTLQPVSVGLSEFSGTGDLASVTGLTINITGNQAADFVLSTLSVTTPEPDIIPAPPALVLALIAAPVLGLRRKFVKA